MKRKLGIMVGHYGLGTGASYELRDEWALAMQDATELSSRLLLDGFVEPIIISIDRANMTWHIVDKCFRDAGGLSRKNINLRAEWATSAQCDLAVELHYNSYTDASVIGHEVLVYRDAPIEGPSRCFAHEIIAQLNERFPQHRNRGIKDRGIAILRLLDKIMPIVLVEPAFIFEEILDRTTWREEYADALKSAVYRFLRIS